MDKDAVYRCMTSCYEWHQTEKRENSPTLGLGGSYLQSAKSIAAFGGSILQGVVVPFVLQFIGINSHLTIFFRAFWSQKLMNKS